jgi:hypothetical protein
MSATAALGHDVDGIQGTVDCDGNFSITVHGDVWDPTDLIVTVNGEAGFPEDGTVVFSGSTGFDEYNVSTYGPFTGTGGQDGMLIEAGTSEDDDDYVSGFLVLTQESCATPTPIPTETPTSSIPDTSLSVLTTDSTGDLLMALFGALACAGLIATIVGTAKRAEKR